MLYRREIPIEVASRAARPERGACLIAFLVALLLLAGCAEFPTTTITTSQLPNARPGLPYAAALSAIGGSPPYRWAITSGALPPGVKLDARNGALSGVPAQIGSFSFTVRVNDSSINKPGTDARPLAMVVGIPSLQITTSVLSNARTGIQFQAGVTATGGVQPYHWSIPSGTLPSGVSLNTDTGILSGKASQGGEFDFAIQVSDSSSPKPQAAVKALTLSVAAAVGPSITTQPTSQTVTVGQAANFSAAFSGTAPLSYQWRKNGTAISGAASSAYTTPVTTSADSGASFTVVVNNSAGSATSSAATLTVTSSPVAPSIITQPASQTVAASQTATFLVAASGTSPLSYQWRKNGTAISGATSSTYTTPVTTSADSGAQFTVVVTNSAGSVTSGAATLTVNAAPVVMITVNPNNATVKLGTIQQFAVSVTGTSNTAVIWSASGVGCSGAACGTISPSGLYTSPASVPSSSTITVKATAMADPTKSASATVTIVAALAVALSISPTSASVPTAGTQPLIATLTGTSNTAVNWSLNGAGCSGSSCGTISTSALSAVYAAPFVPPSPAGVNVIATSMADPTKSAAANLTIVPNVLVSVTPTNVSVPPGTPQQFSAAVTGTSNTTVAWIVSGAGCSGAACGIIDSSGRYTAPSAVPSQPTVTAVASSIADPTKSASANVTIASAASTDPVNRINIPPSHPRLFWNTARLAKAQTWWASNSYTPNYINSNPFDPYDTLFACLMSNNSTWCNAQINWAVNLVDATNCYQTVGCDSMRVYGETVMLTYDWLYAKMTPTQRATLISNWNTWQNYLDTQNSWGNTGMPSSNYFAGAFRTDFAIGVATQGDGGNAAAFLNYGLNSRWAALVNYDSPTGAGPIGAKGYAFHNQEGLQYGRYSLSYYSIPLASSALLGRDLWQETAAFKAGVLQTIYNTMPTQTVSRGLYDGWTWSDDENWISGSGLYGGGGMQSRYYGDFMIAAAQESPTSAIGKFARQWISTVKPTIGPMWMAVDLGGNTQPFSTLPLDYYASGPQYAYWRNSWNTNASSLFLQMGETSGVGHSHFDVGAFQWFRNGSYLIRETPTYLTTLAGYNSSGTVGGDSGFAHNVPLIGGMAEVSAGCMDSNAAIRRLESQPTYAYIDADISGTYTNSVCSGNHPERENAAAQHVEREFIFFRDIEVLLILDRLQADTASRGKTFTSHCETNPVSTDASHYTCVDGGQQASYSVLLPAIPALVVVNEAGNSATCGAGACQYRLEVNDNSPIGAQSYFLVAIQGLSASGAPLRPTVQDLGNSWTVTLDGNHSATLNKGMSSAGGTVTINGTTTNLRADAQSMTISDDGPVW